MENGENQKRKELKKVVYFGGLHRGKDNEKLWGEERDFIKAVRYRRDRKRKQEKTG